MIQENIYERTHFNFFGSDSFTKKKIENEPFALAIESLKIDTSLISLRK